MNTRGAQRGRAAGRATRSEEVSARELHGRWKSLHQGDREPWPDVHLISQWERESPELKTWVSGHGGPAAVAHELTTAWAHFHEGEFTQAIKLGSKLGAFGAAVANKAAAIQTLDSKSAQAERTLEEAMQRGESAVRLLDAHANTHYTLALVLGRYSQRISILKAVAEGFAGRVRSHLERTIALEPRHAEAHVALGLYHAELTNKLGSMAALLTYGASASAAQEYFGRALKLAPASPIVHIEYANGLLLLDRSRHARQAAELYEQAAGFEPLDAMERMDVERAKRGISG